MEKKLSFIHIFSTFTFYGFDVTALALLTAVATQIIKKLFFKRSRKLVTFLPFMLGTLFYAVYASVRNLDALYAFEEHVSVMEHGISVGAIATLCYVLYEQFVREKSGLSTTEKVISTLIEGYVPSDRVEAVAKAVAEAIGRDVTGNGALRAQEILAENSDGEITERDIQLLSRLIIETLAHMSTQ